MNVQKCFSIFVVILCSSNMPNSATAANKLDAAPQSAITVCAECHGKTGISPNQDWPHLAGQKYGYLLNELRNFKDKKRTNELMSPSVASMSDLEMQALARYYSNQKIVDNSHNAIDTNAHSTQKQIKEVAAHLCVPCHGVNGISLTDAWPNLAGQNSAYILKQLYDFRDRTRRGFMVDLNVDEMLRDEEFQMVADYFSGMPIANDPKNVPASPEQQNADGVNKIVEVGSGLYLHVWGDWISPFLVTSDGIIITDPPSVAAALWLKQALKERFNLPIRYVILSHSDTDHISGARVFANDTMIIAHENTIPIIKKRLRTEAKAAIRAKRVAETPAEAIPNITFRKAMTLSLGDKNIELTRTNPEGHPHDETISMYFVEAELLYEPDEVQIGALAFMGFRFTELTKTLEEVKATEQKDYTYFINGHSLAVPKTAVSDYRRFLEALKQEVKLAIDQGKTMEEAMKDIRLPQFRHLIGGDSTQAQQASYNSQLKFNIKGAYKQLKAIKEGREIKKKGKIIDLDY